MNDLERLIDKKIRDMVRERHGLVLGFHCLLCGADDVPGHECPPNLGRHLRGITL